jgi:hypothetical protein
MTNRSTTTTAIKLRVATAATRCAWAILRAADRLRDLGLRTEAWAGRLAYRWGVDDDVVATLTGETPVID